MAPRSSSLRAQLARLCLCLLTVGDDAVMTKPIHLRVWDDDDEVEVVMHFSPAELRAAGGPPDPNGLSPVAVATCRVLTDTPQTAKTLARLAGYRLNPHFRGGLRELQRHDPPLCVKTPEGYRRPLQ